MLVFFFFSVFDWIFHLKIPFTTQQQCYLSVFKKLWPLMENWMRGCTVESVPQDFAICSAIWRQETGCLYLTFCSRATSLLCISSTAWNKPPSSLKFCSYCRLQLAHSLKPHFHLWLPSFSRGNSQNGDTALFNLPDVDASVSLESDY